MESIPIEEIVDSSSLANIDFRDLRRGTFGRLTKNATNVQMTSMVSGNNPLYSLNFSRCQALAFLDLNSRIGALGHLYSLDSFRSFMNGIPYSKYSRLVVPRRIFEDKGDVRVVHVYHKEDCGTSREHVDEVLNEEGFESVTHIPLILGNEEEADYFDVALHPKRKEFYINLRSIGREVKFSLDY